jgi:sugar O-acyltransferase (sialic acid O-acetyltransferase NeuD family)
MMKNVVIYGQGGFGKELACLLKQINEVSPEWNLLGYIDDGLPLGTENRYGKVIGNMDALNNWTDGELNVIVSIANPHVLAKISENVTNPHILFPNILAPNVNVFDKDAIKMGKGNIFFFGCRVSCDVEIGDFNICVGLNSFGHDVKVGNCNVFSPSVRLSGCTSVGNQNFFGVGSIVLQGLKVGSNIRLGAGSVLMTKPKDGYLYMGNPAKKTEL